MFWCNVPGTVVDKAAKIITDPEDDEQDAAVGLLGLFDGSGDFVSKTKEENKKKSRSLLDGVDIVGQKESSPDDVSLFSFPENDMPNMSHNNNSTIIVQKGTSTGSYDEMGMNSGSINEFHTNLVSPIQEKSRKNYEGVRGLVPETLNLGYTATELETLRKMENMSNPQKSQKKVKYYFLLLYIDIVRH